ncbi:unnamed protein product [marine sediment metagenome]|uniref:Uncharacterized protein n=1 Tax=marine sediment metagenome TaxID=412755 RepID=X0WAP6_9ZZZZ
MEEDKTKFTANMGSNREDKICYKLWLTEQEEKILLESMKSTPSIAWTIVRKAHKRGDFEKNGTYNK